MAKKRKNKHAHKEQETPSPVDGYDFGWPEWRAGIVDPSFNQLLFEADTVGCVYGERYSSVFKCVLPFVALIAKNPAPLKQAIEQLQKWTDTSGLGAVTVEILYHEEGYRLSVGPSFQHLIWRTASVDDFYDPTAIGISFIKTIDSRNPILEALREYSTRPLAPVFFDGAMALGDVGPHNPPSMDRIQPIPGLEPVLLLKLPVYRSTAETPSHSMLAQLGSSIPKKSRGQQPVVTPRELGARRDRRLRAILPFTLHVLRTDAASMSRASSLGLSQWQVEQAIANLILEKHVSLGADLPADERRRAFVEGAASYFETAANKDAFDISDDAIRARVLADGRYLLRQLGTKKLPLILSDLQHRLTARALLPASAPQ